MSVSSIFRTDLLAGKVVAITGGGSGIGRAIAEECVGLGATVVIGARKLERLEAAAGEVGCDHAALDIRDTGSVQAWADGIVERHERIDVLVNNAGGQFPSPAIGIPHKGWRAVVDTNLNGTWYMTQAAARHMIKAGSGRVINIVANMWRGFPGMAHTGAARAGVVNLTKTLALEWARHGILVNAIAPGIIRSSGLDTYPEALRATFDTEVPKHIPLKRMGKVEDVAWAVVYLASPAGDYITGETVCVDGGQAHWGTVYPI